MRGGVRLEVGRGEIRSQGMVVKRLYLVIEKERKLGR